MSASIRIKVMGGTDIETAYFDCEKASASLGGISVETTFNGVEMFYHRQSLGEWKNEYKKMVYGLSKDGSARANQAANTTQPHQTTVSWKSGLI